jgi:hypothetical protein
MPMGFSPAYSPYSPYAAQSPYYSAGAQVADTGGYVVQSVATPVLNFSRGLLAGRGIWLGLGIIAIVLYNENKKA